MKKTDELLQIIENGDPAKILSEDDLVERLNFLLKYNLVTICENKINITEKGKEARSKGVSIIIEEEDLKKELSGKPVKISKKKKFLDSILGRLRKNISRS